MISKSGKAVLIFREVFAYGGRRALDKLAKTDENLSTAPQKISGALRKA